MANELSELPLAIIDYCAICTLEDTVPMRSVIIVRTSVASTVCIDILQAKLEGGLVRQVLWDSNGTLDCKLTTPSPLRLSFNDKIYNKSEF